MNKIFLISNLIGFIFFLITPLKIFILKDSNNHTIKFKIMLINIKIDLNKLDNFLVIKTSKTSFRESIFETKKMISSRKLFIDLLKGIKINHFKTYYYLDLMDFSLNEIRFYYMVSKLIKNICPNYSYGYCFFESRRINIDLKASIRFYKLIYLMLKNIKNIMKLLKGYKNGKRDKLYQGKLGKPKKIN